MKINLEDYNLEKLKPDQLSLLFKLLKDQNLADKIDSIKKVDIDTPINYIKLKENYDSIRYVGERLVSGCKGVILEGGARSRKTYSFIDLLVYVCLYCVNNKTIIILRDTYNSFHTTLFTDLEVALDEFGLHNPFKTSTQVSQLKIRENRIHFKGADNVNNAHGAPSYLLYFNEMLTIPKKIFDNYVMRCSHMWVGDFNPSVTEHWVFESLIPRPDVLHVRTTYLDNPHVPAGVVAEIKGYEPFLPGSYKIINDTICFNNDKTRPGEWVPISETNMPPEHPTNCINGTADLFNWKVYGLGLRGAMQGVIFENVNYIDEFPEYMDYIYGNDFGFTNDPNATVKYAETDTDIYIELMLYQCVETPESLDEILDGLGVDRYKPFPMDNSDKYTAENKGTVEMVKGMKKRGWQAFKIRKTKNVIFWITSMKKKRINIVKNGNIKFAKKEQENYVYKEINGILLNVPKDAHNHMWDAARYCHMTWNTPQYVVNW